MEIGKRNNLRLDRFTGVGAYLTEEGQSGNREGVLLPKKEIRREMKIGDVLDVFVYLDSDDRPIATLRDPKIHLGETAVLRVKDMGKVGAFMDWGLEKDLLLPHSEQHDHVKRGKDYLVYLYADKSGRLCVTTKVYDHLRSDPPYKAGDWVHGYVYQIQGKLGAFVAVDNKYHGMVQAKDMDPDIHTGTVIKCRVIEVRRDGKMVLSHKKKAYREIPLDASKILMRLEKSGGSLPYNDKTKPEIIAREFGMSKASFKRALGRLLKMHRITQTSQGIMISAEEKGKRRPKK